MRSLVLTLLAVFLPLSQLSAAPTAQEQANYDAACVAVVAAVNAYRSANSRTALTPLVELCQGAREDAEYEELGVGVPKYFYDRAWEIGYGGTFYSNSAFHSRAPASAAVLFQKLLATPGYPAVFLSTEASYIGVGFALKMEGASTEYRLRITLGKVVGGLPADGTTGQETGTGRGLLDISLLREIRAGAWSGNSINGFVRDPSVVVLTTAEERAFVSALAAFVRKSSSVKIALGKGVNVRLPSAVAKFVEKFVLKGKLPPGIRFNKRTNSFRGSAKGSGRFRVTLTGKLSGTVKGSEKLKPIRIQFAVGG